MTISYTGQVATCTGLGCFWKLLFRWRGSIYKLLWPNLLVYSFFYFTISAIYRFGLSDENRTVFEKLVLHCQTYGDLIPVAFVLGFYVSIVITRWWEQYITMPWPDNMALFVSTLVQGQDERGRLMRRTIIRYVNLCLVITLRMMSPRVKKRFPSLDHLVEAGFLLPNEKKIFEDLDTKTQHPKYWMPLVWAGSIITRARKENRVKDDFSLKTLIDGLNSFRAACGGLLNYDWISIPLVYTQVVTLAVYVYFMATLLGTQYLDPKKGYPKHEVDLIIPVFTFLQFFFYMGWLKVAESLVNPFGEDDDDFELNWLVDRNLQVSYVIVDEMHQEHPELVKDQYWDEIFPAELPYTAASKQYHTGPPAPSTAQVAITEEEAEFVPLLEPEEADAGGDGEKADIERGSEATQPLKIHYVANSKRSASIGSSNLSMSRAKGSVLNMLSKIFRPGNESGADLASRVSSNVSLSGRRHPWSSSRLSQASPEQHDPEETMFHLSNVSLAGSAASNSSQIQIKVPLKTLEESSSNSPNLTRPQGGRKSVDNSTLTSHLPENIEMESSNNSTGSCEIFSSGDHPSINATSVSPSPTVHVSPSHIQASSTNARFELEPILEQPINDNHPHHE